MAEGALSIKLRCASWQQLATIYKRDLSRSRMFLRAAAPPPIGTAVHVDLTLPSGTVIALEGTVDSHLQDPQRGSGVELALAPLAASSVWLIESALASEQRRIATPVRGVPIAGAHALTGIVPTLGENAEVTAAEQELIKALMSEAESLKKLNPFLVLGVGYEASDAEVRAAFGELTKRYHPDRFARYESIELRQVAAEIFILIRDAYRRLVDAAARAQVLQSIGRTAPATAPGPATRTVAVPPRRPPSVPPARGSARVMPHVPPLPGVPVPLPSSSSGAIPSAIPASRSAPVAAPGAALPVDKSGATAIAPGASRPPIERSLRRVPGEGPPPGAVASPAALPERRPASGPFSQTQPAPTLVEPGEIDALDDLIDQGRLDEALAGYRLLGKRAPGDRNARAGIELCEGLLALAARDRLEAAQRFETALEIDPSNERAARELAEMRRQATNERKGLLSRLMGKKEP